MYDEYFYYDVKIFIEHDYYLLTPFRVNFILDRHIIYGSSGTWIFKIYGYFNIPTNK